LNDNVRPFVFSIGFANLPLYDDFENGVIKNNTRSPAAWIVTQAGACTKQKYWQKRHDRTGANDVGEIATKAD